MTTTLLVSTAETCESPCDIAVVELQFPLEDIQAGLPEALMKKLLTLCQPLLEGNAFDRLGLMFLVNGVPVWNQIWTFEAPAEGTAWVQLEDGSTLWLTYGHSPELPSIVL